MHVLFEVAAHQNVAASLQLREAVELLERCVVLDRHVTLDDLELLERQLAELLVVDKGETRRDLRQVVGRDG